MTITCLIGRPKTSNTGHSRDQLGSK